MYKEDSDIPLRVFFSYSYRDGNWLKEIIQNSCKIAGVHPVFAEEEIDFGDNILQKLRQIILSSDMTVAIVTRSIAPAVFTELEYFYATNKPTLLIVQKPLFRGRILTSLRQTFWTLKGLRFVSFENESELQALLSSSISNFKLRFETLNIKRLRKEQNKIADILRKSLQKNVLVLGKDSDAEGLQKIDRISKVIEEKKFIPVRLKDLPEIKFLILEDKMIRIGGLCRFVIAEDSRPSGAIDEVRLCITCQYVTATVREVGTASSWMQAHYPSQFKFINNFCYINEPSQKNLQDTLCDNIFDSLENATENATLWAENRIREQEKIFRKTIYSNF